MIIIPTWLLNMKQAFCRHRWQITKFQSLTPATSYRCEKCGAVKSVDWESLHMKKGPRHD